MGDVVMTAIWGSTLDLGGRGIRIRGPAQPFVDAMERPARDHDRLVLATRALRRDPDCIEALLVVAEHCQDSGRRILYLNIAVEAGSVHWDTEDMRELVDRGYAAVPGARPWMRAIKALGNAYAEAGEPDDARDCYERLLAMDVSDALDAQAALQQMQAPAPGM